MVSPRFLLYENHEVSHVERGRVGKRRSFVGMCRTAQNQSKTSLLFVTGSFGTVAQPIMTRSLWLLPEQRRRSDPRPFRRSHVPYTC